MIAFSPEGSSSPQYGSCVIYAVSDSKGYTQVRASACQEEEFYVLFKLFDSLALDRTLVNMNGVVLD